MTIETKVGERIARLHSYGTRNNGIWEVTVLDTQGTPLFSGRFLTWTEAMKEAKRFGEWDSQRDMFKE